MRTVRNFIAGTDGDANMANQSLLAMHAQAAILYEGATRLASRYSPCKSYWWLLIFLAQH